MNFLFFTIILNSCISNLYSNNHIIKLTTLSSNCNTEFENVEKCYDDTIKKEYIFNYENEIKIRGFYINGKKDGKWIYTPDRKFKIIGNYVNDSLMGKWVYIDKKDTLSILNYYKNKLHGLQYGYYKNGVVNSITPYQYGKKHGIEKIFYKNGEIRAKISFYEGQLHGNYIKFSKSGDTLGYIEYFKDTPINLIVNSEDYYESPLFNKTYSGNLKNGTGSLTTWYSEKRNSIKILERNFQDSVLSGEIKGYSTFGEKSFEGNYKDGYMIDTWFFYYYNNTKEINYSNKDLKVDTSETRTMDHDDLFYQFYEREYMPEFNGDDHNSFGFHIMENLIYPNLALHNNIKGRVFVQFSVSILGELTDISVVKGAHELLDEEALRVIKNSPPWKPGFQYGQPTKTILIWPVVFIIDDSI
jgi:TonB family protein